MIDDNFVEYLDAARMEALPERERDIFGLRYGLSGNNIYTLAEIAKLYGLSRERIRQLLNRSQRRISSKAKRQIKSGNANSPCAALLQYLKDIIQPEKIHSDQRLLEFIEEKLTFLPSIRSVVLFIATLVYPNKDLALEHNELVTKLIHRHRLERSRELSSTLQLKKTRRLLSKAIWPKQVRRLNSTNIEKLKRQRNVSTEGDGKAGFFFSTKLNRNVQYESDLELRFFQQIESDENIIAYQEQPLKIAYEKEGKKHSYYPDALLIFKDYRCIIVEIKPVFHMALHDNQVKWKYLKYFCEKFGLGLLITDGIHSMQEIRRHKINNEYVIETLSHLEKGPIDWNQYMQIKDAYSPNRNDFVAMILNNSLRWQLGPFKLSSN